MPFPPAPLLACALLAAAVQEQAKPPEPAAPRALLLRGATLHSMLPGDPPRVADVRIEEGRIRALGPAAASGSEPEVLELAGKHLVPGLIDAHVNFDPQHDALYLAAGVTLVRDLGGDHHALHVERASERRDRVPGPALLTAGAALDGDPPAAASAVVLRNPDAAESYLPILFQEGVDFLSVLPGLPEASWRKAIELAHAKELPVFGPRPANVSLADALAAGQDGFHALDSLLPPGVLWDGVAAGVLDDAIAALARAKKPLVPLLQASAARLDDQESDPARAALAGLLAPSYEAWWRAELAQRKPYLEPERRALGELALEKQAHALRALYDAGARLLAGSGAPQPWLLPGTALHQELRQWTRAGIPTRAVLELATRGAAEALGLAGERGTLAVGAWADILVLDQDPSEDLGRLLDPAWVIVRGRALGRAAIAARLEGLGKHQAAVRSALATPVEVAPPPQAEEGHLLLEGTVEHATLGLRLSTERYRVVRLANDALLFTTRIVYPGTAEAPGRELTLEQFVRAGRLQQVHAVLQEAGKVLEHDGLWTANTWRMQSRLDGQVISSPAPFREQPVCVDAGSVTALLILGQTPLDDVIRVVELHPGFDAEPVNWSLALDEEGNHRVRTHVGFKAFRLDGIGALEWGLTKVGTGVIEVHRLSSSAFGGAGLPALEEHRARAPNAAEDPAAPEAGG
jgi:hypothetical protein